ncbi:MAG: S41 family peptidase [Longimonas sp.]|uniref:S41 family peptidase n=1 Tax=Longimonas sp. TaxID=2039626 RepID=UPI003976A1B3
MKRITHYVLPAIGLVLLGVVLGVQVNSFTSDNSAYEQLQKLERSFVIITRQYVDPVESEALVEDGIEGMLEALDPHSTYIPSDEVQGVQDTYRGSFGGIGVMFEMVEDTARVISPIADGPSERLGIMGGDRIVQIEGESAVGIGTNGIQDRLKGEVGTTVDLTVYRPGAGQEYEFEIERDEISMNSINTSYMIDDQTGYVKIDRFAMTTHEEFMEHVGTLKDEGMERLVLDLRGNPGGVMRSAVDIADEMLEEGLTIVETKGRERSMNSQFRAEEGGSLEDNPVIVLVNQGSASASEIVSGALQDHDRALVVGQRTFGKALIQKQFELDDNSLLQMTVGRYYTPVGRLIQTPYENEGTDEQYVERMMEEQENATFHPEEYKDSIPDSLMYTTEGGRTVFGGGGIMPDVVVQPDTTSLTNFVSAINMDFAFTREWFMNNEQQVRSTWGEDSDAFLNDFTTPDSLVTAFWDFTEEQGVTYTSDPDETAPGEGVFSEAEKNRSEEEIRLRLKGYLARQLYGLRTAQPTLNETDPIYLEALSLWGNAEELATMHMERQE